MSIIDCIFANSYTVAGIFFLDNIQLQSANFSCSVRNGTVTIAKGLHDEVCLRRDTPIRHKWLTVHGFQNYEYSNRFVKKKVKFLDRGK